MFICRKTGVREVNQRLKIKKQKWNGQETEVRRKEMDFCSPPPLGASLLRGKLWCKPGDKSHRDWEKVAIYTG